MLGSTMPFATCSKLMSTCAAHRVPFDVARLSPCHNRRCLAPFRAGKVGAVGSWPFLKRSPVCVSASLTVRDDKAGVEWPLAQKYWEGEECRCLGAGPRFKKIAFLNVKVYSASLYVEAVKAAKELGVRYRGGYFASEDDYMTAIIDGAFNKVVVVHLVRDVDGATFAEAIDKVLAPRVRISGLSNELAQFVAFFQGKKLANNTEVVLYWNVSGDLEIVLVPNATLQTTFKDLSPEFRLRSPGLCRALFEVFAGESSVVPEARSQWVQGTKTLLDSEQVKRETRKAGS